MPTARGSFSALLDPKLHKVYIDVGKERPLEYTEVFNIADMDWNPITDQQLSGLGTMPSKTEGSQFKLDEPLLGGQVAYTASPFGLAVEFTWEMWRDELYGVMEEMTRELARASRNRQEVDAWSVLNNSFSTSFAGFKSGESLCSTSHTGLDGQTRANRPSTEIGFSVAGIQAGIASFESMTDERGLPRLMAPAYAIVDPSNKFIAREILGSAGKPYTANNELNALLKEDLSWMVSHYMTTATNWWLLAAKGVHDLNFWWRDHPIRDAFDDPWTKNAIETLYQRHTKGFGLWRGVYGSVGA